MNALSVIVAFLKEIPIKSFELTSAGNWCGWWIVSALARKNFIK